MDRSAVKISQEVTGLGMERRLAITKTRKLEFCARAFRIDASWERTVSGEDLSSRETCFRYTA